MPKHGVLSINKPMWTNTCSNSTINWVCMEAMVKFTKQLKVIVQIMCLHWVGNILTFMQIISGNLFLTKVTRKETHSSTSFHETSGRSYFTALRLLCLNLLEIESNNIVNTFKVINLSMKHLTAWSNAKKFL